MATQTEILRLDHVGMRREGARFELRSPTGQLLGALHPADGLTIENRADGVLKRTVTDFKLPPSEEAQINPLSDRVWAYWNVEGVDYPLGVFLFAQWAANRHSFGLDVSTRLLDQGLIMSQTLSQTLGFPAGTLVADALAQVFQAAGFTTYQIAPSSTAVTTEPLAWAAGGSDTYASVASHLCGIGGLTDWFFDNTGLLRADVPPDLAGVPALVYEAGRNIIDGSIVEESDLLAAPNRYVVVDNANRNAPVYAVYDLPNEAQNSYVNRGWRVTRTIEAPGIGNADAAAAYAERFAQADPRAFETVTFSGPPDPRHDTFDLVSYLGATYRELSWRLRCQPGGPHEHTIRRVFAPLFDRDPPPMVQIIGPPPPPPPPPPTPSSFVVTDRGAFFTTAAPSVSATAVATSQSFTPTAGDILLLEANAQTPGGAGITLSVSTTLQNTAFTLIDSATVDQGASGVAMRTSVWLAVVGASPGTGTVSVTRSGGNVAQWLYCHMIETNGGYPTITNHAAVTNSSTGTFSVPLPSTPQVDSLLFGAALFNSDPTVTLPPGTTQLDNVSATHSATSFWDADGTLAQTSVWGAVDGGSSSWIGGAGPPLARLVEVYHDGASVMADMRARGIANGSTVHSGDYNTGANGLTTAERNDIKNNDTPFLYFAGLPDVIRAAQTTVSALNVKNAPYNAAGDGVTDDRAAIQAALDDAVTDSSHAVYLPPGVYLIGNQLTYDSGITIFGDGIDVATIRSALGRTDHQYAGQSMTPMFDVAANGVHDTTFRDFTIDQRGDSYDSGGDVANAWCVSVNATTNVTMQRVGFRNIRTIAVWSDVPLANETVGLKLLDCHVFQSNGDGFSFFGSYRDFVVSGNHLEWCKDDAIAFQNGDNTNYGTNILVENNTINDCTVRCSFGCVPNGIMIFGVDHVTCRNNNVARVVGSGIRVQIGGSSRRANNVSVTNNTVTGAGISGDPNNEGIPGWGIMLYSCDTITVSGNTVTNSRQGNYGRHDVTALTAPGITWTDF